MKPIYSATAVTLLVLTGCSSQSEVWTEKSGDIDTAIEVEIAVRSHPFEPGDVINEGKFFVVSSNVIPIRSTGGPGHTISDSDGVIVELQWDDVRLLQSRINQRHRFEYRLLFQNVRFNIQNQLVRPDGVTHRIRSTPDSLTLDGTFDPIVSPLTFSSPADDVEHALVIRARLLTEEPPAKPLVLPIENAGITVAALIAAALLGVAVPALFGVEIKRSFLIGAIFMVVHVGVGIGFQLMFRP